jgi:hypothetical protein
MRTLEQILRNTTRRGKCRLWKGTVRVKNGLPQVGFDGRKILVTRLVYTLTHPNDPPRDDEAVVHVHACRYRSCVAPEHLECVPTTMAWKYRKSLQDTLV